MPDAARTRDVVVAAFDGVQALDVTGPWEVFAGADQLLRSRGAARPGYRPALVSIDGDRCVTTDSGLVLGARSADHLPPRFDTLVLPGGGGARVLADDPTAVARVSALVDRADRVLTVCTGAFLAAAAGAADDRRMATHWAHAAALARRHPQIEVDPDAIHVHDGRLWSSAGVTAGIDLALAVVEHDHDADVAQTVARWLVMFLRRPGGQSQFAAPVWSERAGRGPIREAQDLIDTDPAADLRVGVLARRVGMSERNFTRRFTHDVGSSPARYIATVRVESARRALEQTDDTVETIADRCGFGTAETMRRTFARRLGVSPDHYRRRFRPTSEEPVR